jgi:hypothetical protein
MGLIKSHYGSLSTPNELIMLVERCRNLRKKYVSQRIMLFDQEFLVPPPKLGAPSNGIICDEFKPAVVPRRQI